MAAMRTKGAAEEVKSASSAGPPAPAAAPKTGGIPRPALFRQGSPSASRPRNTTQPSNSNAQQQQARPCSCGQVHGEGASSAPRGLLAALGLHEHSVRNVIMARDIVPRAFACDYSLVADILKSWGPAFKHHGGLAHPGRKHLYYFVGECWG
jgi:hypothetical protein